MRGRGEGKEGEWREKVRKIGRDEGGGDELPPLQALPFSPLRVELPQGERGDRGGERL